MSADPSPPTASPALPIAIGFVIGAVVVGSSWLATRAATSPANVVRDVSVSYMYETNPGEASGSNDRRVQSIQFYPGYVIVTADSGRSDLFSVDRLRKFQFSPASEK